MNARVTMEILRSLYFVNFIWWKSSFISEINKKNIFHVVAAEEEAMSMDSQKASVFNFSNVPRSLLDFSLVRFNNFQPNTTKYQKW